ncbi:hypothetical protein VTN00DRAFT_9224 [Thermoascus crustaceus]|uniref:uncharacterized protein n=1 Tax=Thermoascus crustaceus TaxID=5088 RepID=UPI0037431B90
MYEPLYLSFDAYPSVVPRVRVRGVMALFLAATILWALVWLLYRAWQVCQTPNDILVDKLGLDIPPAPEVTLEEISAREIRIAWKQPDFHNSIHKHIIQVNGVKVGESKRAETAVAISNLIPGNIYHLCVFAVSAANFQTASAVLHVRTKPLPLSQTQQNGTVGGPTIQASIPRSTAASVAPSAPVMAREHSGGQLQGKRSAGGRKLSPASTATDATHAQTDDLQKNQANEDTDETLEQLAERLKALQHENETVDKQINDEEEEHNVSLKELEKQRDELKQRVKEKDEASGDLKKHVNKLESVNRTVQSEKTKRERLLQQKEAERKKRKDDIVRWQEQISQMDKDIARAREEKSRVEEEAAKQTSQIRSKIANEQAEMKTIDDEIQDKGGRIKKLEEERKKLQGGDSEDGKELDRIDTERARQWEIRLSNLHARYATLVNLHTQAQQQYQEAQERLKWLTAQRSSASGPFAPLPPIELDLSHAPMRRSRHRSSLTSDVPSPINFPAVEPSFAGSVNYNAPSTSSPTFAPSSAFFNINNGMTISDQSQGIRADSDISLSNPPMSPHAGALLPSDLLGDEESPDLPGPVTHPRFSGVEQSNAQLENLPHGSPSPVSSGGSRSASIFTSPHESLNNHQETDSQNPGLSQGEVSSGVQSASRRLSGLFGFNRQRGKTLADGPPLLGSLKPGQSQSFPRNLDDMDPIGARRRRLSYTGSWANAMSLFPRSNAANVTADSSSDHLPSRRVAFSNIFSSKFGTSGASSLLKSSAEPSDSSGGYNQFSPRHDPIDPSSILGTVRRGSLSPRPSSTFSFDNQLPHPSTDNRHFGWPSTEQTGHRASPLGLDWASPTTWSRAQSRRPSTQYGSSGHLPLSLSGEPDFIHASFDKQHRPLQAPIGTRPSSSHRPVTPKLNPAAPSFKTLFGKKSEKEKEKDKGKDQEPDTSQSRDVDSNADDCSPAESRRSKDSRSVSTSAAESYESLERVPSGTPSENVNPKESFIQKITRKSSSSKFNLSWKDRAGLFSKKGDSSQGDNIDEDTASETQLGKSVDSVASSTFSIEKSSKSSLGFFSRKSKKSDKTTSESSERASETGDEEMSEEVQTS